MSMHRSRCALFVFLLLAGVAAHAQKTEVSLTLGAAVSPDGKGPVTCGEAIICPIPQGTIGSVSIGPGISWQASLAYRLANFRAAALYVELPFAGSPSRTGPGGIIFNGDFSSVFFTPAAHVKFLPRSSISPFASLGGGLAHFSSSSSSSNTGALQVGGGVDFRTPLRVLGIRIEARDFITGHSPFLGFTSKVQHIFAGGGIVVKF